MIKDKSIFIKNIYYMLSYAFMPLVHDGFEDVDKEEFDNIFNLFASILSKGVGKQLKQGLYREYINQTEDLAGLKGKIDVNGTFKNVLEKKKLITCNYDDLSENNILNQIIKTTVFLLLKQDGVSSGRKADLKKEMLFFSDVDLIEPRTINWSRIRFHRNNNNYRVLISVCQLIWEGMLITTEKGEYRLATFVKPEVMSHLYEKFILEYYKQEHKEINTSASQIAWVLDDGFGTLLPVMQSDVMLSKDNKVLIIDAKYYTESLQHHYDKSTIHSNNLYQIFTYVKNKEEELKECPHEVSGMLLYAKTDEDIYPDNDYMMSGNRIGVHTLNLGVEFSSIREYLDGIVREYFE